MSFQNALEDIREEYRLTGESLEHVTWLLRDGLLNPTDIRAMLSRQAVESLHDRHGPDVNGWPSLSTVAPPPSAARKQKATLPPAAASHRGWGAIPTQTGKAPADGPEVVVLDWGNKGPERTPLPSPKPRARTSSPSKGRWADLRTWMTGRNRNDEHIDIDLTQDGMFPTSGPTTDKTLHLRGSLNKAPTGGPSAFAKMLSEREMGQT